MEEAFKKFSLLSLLLSTCRKQQRGCQEAGSIQTGEAWKAALNILSVCGSCSATDIIVVLSTVDARYHLDLDVFTKARSNCM